MLSNCLNSSLLPFKIVYQKHSHFTNLSKTYHSRKMELYRAVTPAQHYSADTCDLTDILPVMVDVRKCDIGNNTMHSYVVGE